MNVKLIRKNGAEEIMTAEQLAAISDTLNLLKHLGDDQDGIQPVKREASDAEQAAAEQAAADAEAERLAAEAAEATRLAARPKRSEIDAAKAATQAAASVADLRASMEGLIDLMDRVLLFQGVDVDEDA